MMGMPALCRPVTCTGFQSEPELWGSLLKLAACHCNAVSAVDCAAEQLHRMLEKLVHAAIKQPQAVAAALSNVSEI